jgi:hypothetical protein
MRTVRVLPHIKRLDDCFSDFLVRVLCECGACREIQPQALARLVGWKVTLKELALRMRVTGSSFSDAFLTRNRRPPTGTKRLTRWSSNTKAETGRNARSRTRWLPELF